jgi:hypothetical protein
MFLRTRSLACLIAVFAAGCGDGRMSTPTGPTSSSAPIASSPAAPTQQTIRGTVQDPAGRWLVGAKVEALDGPSTGVSAVVHSDGMFDFNGFFDQNTHFRATFEGHESLTDTPHCSVTDCTGSARPWMFFQLRPLAAPIDLAGDYTLTITNAEGCSTLPLYAVSRNYQVTLTPKFRDNTADLLGYNVDFHSTAVLESMRRLTIGVAGDYISLFIYRGEADPGLAEDLGSNRYVSYVGESKATLNRASLSMIDLTFDGTIEAVVTRDTLGPTYAPLPANLVSKERCTSQFHRLVLTRVR